MGDMAMEYMMMRKRQMMRKRILRLIVIAGIYAGLLLGAVAAFLGMVWFIKNTVYGWWVVLIGCLFVGGWLFFCLAREGCLGRTVRYS